MKKFTLQFTLTSILFLLINTSYFWEGELGLFFLIVVITAFVIYFLLFIELIRQLYISIRDKFREKKRNILLLFIPSCLALVAIKPKGLINFEKLLEGEDKIFAQAEGVANCTTTLKFKTDKNFIYESICFGIDRLKGEYTIQNNTVYFNSRKNFEYRYGIIDKNKTMIKLYRNKSDAKPYGIPILKNFKN
ncbi:hypothetical protein SAMN05443633_103154 [Chryseobacterium arachidis]|uniref:Uncharacterized protein n=1 Tax=Chryseobacterium arachidis TaxID=1416778 RepID=A0A1M4ZHE3_9FLAO|nr:hypothetical protein [Chryseobacterium arachidis]SHF17006.1 hypothetical protein SAMN05443633_103154 [Chryseobacterium arachidis]